MILKSQVEFTPVCCISSDNLFSLMSISHKQPKGTKHIKGMSEATCRYAHLHHRIASSELC